MEVKVMKNVLAMNDEVAAGEGAWRSACSPM